MTDDSADLEGGAKEDESRRDAKRRPDENDKEFLRRRNARRFRLEVGLDQANAAVQLGITSSYLSKIEAGHRPFTLEVLEAMAEAYRHKIDDFKEENPPPAAPPKEFVSYKTLPGFKLDDDIEARVQRVISEANREQLDRLRTLKEKEKKPGAKKK